MADIPPPTDAQRTYLHPKNLEIQYGVHRDNAFIKLLIKLLADQSRRIAILEAGLAARERQVIRILEHTGESALT